MSTLVRPIADVYLAHGILGNLGRPGAPIMHYKLMVSPSNHRVSGFVEITQALPPPHVNPTFQVEGFIADASVPPTEQIVVLEGRHTPPVPLPSIPQVVPQLTAAMAIDKAWHGQGSFSYNGTWQTNVPVTPNRD